MNNCYHLLSYKLRFYTRISSPEKSRNHAREKIRSLFTCVWYRQSAADASILDTWLFVGIFSDYGCYVWKLRGYLDISLLSNRVEHSQRNSIATRANVLFSICHSLSVILYLSFSICHSLSVILYLSFSICHSHYSKTFLFSVLMISLLFVCEVMAPLYLEDMTTTALCASYYQQGFRPSHYVWRPSTKVSFPASTVWRRYKRLTF